MQGPDKELRKRDAHVARILGLFFVVLGIPVLAGIFFTDTGIDLTLNLGAGLLLLAIGTFFFWAASRFFAEREP